MRRLALAIALTSALAAGGCANHHNTTQKYALAGAGAGATGGAAVGFLAGDPMLGALIGGLLGGAGGLLCEEHCRERLNLGIEGIDENH